MSYVFLLCFKHVLIKLWSKPAETCQYSKWCVSLVGMSFLGLVMMEVLLPLVAQSDFAPWLYYSEDTAEPH